MADVGDRIIVFAEECEGVSGGTRCTGFGDAIGKCDHRSGRLHGKIVIPPNGHVVAIAIAIVTEYVIGSHDRTVTVGRHIKARCIAPRATPQYTTPTRNTQKVLFGHFLIKRLQAHPKPQSQTHPALPHPKC